MYSTVTTTNAIMLAVNKYALNVRGNRLTNKSGSWVHVMKQHLANVNQSPLKTRSPDTSTTD